MYVCICVDSIHRPRKADTVQRYATRNSEESPTNKCNIPANRSFSSDERDMDGLAAGGTSERLGERPTSTPNCFLISDKHAFSDDCITEDMAIASRARIDQWELGGNH